MFGPDADLLGHIQIDGSRRPTDRSFPKLRLRPLMASNAWPRVAFFFVAWPSPAGETKNCEK